MIEITNNDPHYVRKRPTNLGDGYSQIQLLQSSADDPASLESHRPSGDAQWCADPLTTPFPTSVRILDRSPRAVVQRDRTLWTGRDTHAAGVTIVGIDHVGQSAPTDVPLEPRYERQCAHVIIGDRTDLEYVAGAYPGTVALSAAASEVDDRYDDVSTLAWIHARRTHEATITDRV